MALIDLADYDILDLTLANDFPAEKLQEMLATYDEAFAVCAGDAFQKDFTPKDNEDMKKIMVSADVTPQTLEKFYHERIPHFEAKLAGLALEFKKQFILSVYKNKIDEYKDKKDQYGLAAWEQVLYDAQQDNWHEVSRLLKIIESMKPSPTP